MIVAGCAEQILPGDPPVDDEFARLVTMNGAVQYRYGDIIFEANGTSNLLDVSLVTKTDAATSTEKLGVTTIFQTEDDVSTYCSSIDLALLSKELLQSTDYTDRIRPFLGRLILPVAIERHPKASEVASEILRRRLITYSSLTGAVLLYQIKDGTPKLKPLDASTTPHW